MADFEQAHNVNFDGDPFVELFFDCDFTDAQTMSYISWFFGADTWADSGEILQIASSTAKNSAYGGLEKTAARTSLELLAHTLAAASTDGVDALTGYGSVTDFVQYPDFPIEFRKQDINAVEIAVEAFMSKPEVTLDDIDAERLQKVAFDLGIYSGYEGGGDTVKMRMIRRGLHQALRKGIVEVDEELEFAALAAVSEGMYTPKQEELVELLIQEHPANEAELAAVGHWGLGTVKHHLLDLYELHGVSAITHLAVEAVRSGAYTFVESPESVEADPTLFLPPTGYNGG